jgi:hypothetical protein
MLRGDGEGEFDIKCEKDENNLSFFLSLVGMEPETGTPNP